ncbi:MAG: fumarylacetoacetate hydrolase family protein [Planctomycetota bacterium]
MAANRSTHSAPSARTSSRQTTSPTPTTWASQARSTARLTLITEGVTLLPGTVILTGTPAGVGAAQNPPRFLRPGDTFEVTIECIGTLRNSVRTDG